MAKKSKHHIWLTDGEDLLCAAEEGVSKQSKTLLLTNKRLILIQQLESKELTDVDDKMWKEFKSVSLRQAFWNSTINVNFSIDTPPDLWVFQKVKKSIAATAYRLMKNKEVEKREIIKQKPVAAKIAPLVIKEDKPTPLPAKDAKKEEILKGKEDMPLSSIPVETKKKGLFNALKEKLSKND